MDFVPELVVGGFEATCLLHFCDLLSQAHRGRNIKSQSVSSLLKVRGIVGKGVGCRQRHRQGGELQVTVSIVAAQGEQHDLSGQVGTARAGEEEAGARRRNQVTVRLFAAQGFHTPLLAEAQALPLLLCLPAVRWSRR